jgi:hypothetical protein
MIIDARIFTDFMASWLRKKFGMQRTKMGHANHVGSTIHCEDSRDCET